MDDATLARSLASVVVPGELEARRRSWQITRTAFAEREQLPTPVVPGRWGPIVLAASLLVVAAAVLSPPGRAVIGDLRDAIGRDQVKVTSTQTSLFSLPAKGRLLVDSSRGPWVVQQNGSKRLLGDYRESSWSPFGLYVLGAKADELDALEPSTGRVRWSLARPDVHAARWGGTRTDTRIAYLSGDALHVVAGTGQGDRVLLKSVADAAPAWKPGSEHVLAYVAANGAVRIIDADSGHVRGGWTRGMPRQLEFSSDGALIAARADKRLDVYRDNALHVTTVRPAGPRNVRFVDAAWAPGNPELAYVTYDPATGRSAVWTAANSGRAVSQQLFSGAGRISQVAWSPDGKWVMVAWDGADQWVFVRAGGTKAVTRSSISEQLNGSSSGVFPIVAGWAAGR
jgi:hypothetical protein